jgi:hypothetical protein
MDAILSSITLEQLRIIEDQLANNENAEDSELLDHLVKEVRLTEEQARQALTYRSLYRLNMYLQFHGPITMGEDAMTCEMILGNRAQPRKHRRTS